MEPSTIQTFDRLGIVGRGFRDHLARDIDKAVVMRGAQDVVRLAGDRGTGKELVVRAMHEVARERLGRGGDLVQVSCTNLGADSFDQDLFGVSSRGQRARAGLIDKAAQGTLALHDVDALDPALQGRLLRLLGAREYRRVGDPDLRTTDALLVLVTSQDLRKLGEEGRVQRELVERATAGMALTPLYERRADIRELTQHFAVEAAAEVPVHEFEGLTRQAHTDIENAVIGRALTSVRRLRAIVRDIVFDAATAGLLAEGDPITSDAVMGYLLAELGYDARQREEHDVAEVQATFDVKVQRDLLQELARRHDISEVTLLKLCEVLQEIVATPDGRPKCYRNIVERSNRMMKVAFWLVSQATTQSEFRRFFGQKSFEMPAKSVAWQIYNEVFNRD